MSAQHVAVTGLGAVTPLGPDVATTWAAVRAGRSGVRSVDWNWTEDLPVRIAATAVIEPSAILPKHRMRRLDRGQQFALAAAHEAWRDAGFAFGERAGFTADAERLGAVVSSGGSGILTILNGYEKYRETGWKKVSPFTVPMLMANGPAAWVGLEFGAEAGVHALVSACASSADAIGYGIDMIRSGRADVVITGGTEASVHPLNIVAFSAMRAMSTRNEEPERASRPFDKGRDGFVLGEGSAVLVLESLEHARARGARVHAIAAGVGYSGDSHDIVLPDPTGRGQANAMRRALRDADLVPADVTHINAHATSTPPGDIAEIAAIKAAFGAAAGGLAISATKSMTGHLLGAAGALEALLTVLTLRDLTVPPTINLDDRDDAVDLDIVHRESRALPAGTTAALSNSFGFGGHNVSIAFRRP